MSRFILRPYEIQEYYNKPYEWKEEPYTSKYGLDSFKKVLDLPQKAPPTENVKKPDTHVARHAGTENFQETKGDRGGLRRDGGEFRAPMAVAVIGGLIVSTALSLLFVPAFHIAMDDFSNFIRRPFRRQQPVVRKISALHALEP